jgi:hypothetical protein
MFLRNIDSHKSHTAPHPRRRYCSRSELFPLEALLLMVLNDFHYNGLKQENILIPESHMKHIQMLWRAKRLMWVCEMSISGLLHGSKSDIVEFCLLGCIAVHYCHILDIILGMFYNAFKTQRFTDSILSPIARGRYSVAPIDRASLCLASGPTE